MYLFGVLLLVGRVCSWQGVLVPNSNGYEFGQVFAVDPYVMFGVDEDNFMINSSARADMSVASCGDRVYVTGGRHDPDLLIGSKDIIELLLPAKETIRHSHSFRLTTARYSHASVCVNTGDRRLLYVLGGGNGQPGQRLQSAEVCDLKTHECSHIRRMPQPTANQRAVYAFGRIYMAGGYSNAGSNSLYAYDVEDDGWTELARMRQSHAEFGLAAYNGRLLACGGWTGARDDQPLGKADCEVYDPLHNTWTEAAPMNQARVRPGLVCSAGQLVVFGGLVDGLPSASIELFDVDSRNWTLLHVALLMPFVYAENGVAANNGP